MWSCPIFYFSQKEKTTSLAADGFPRILNSEEV
jgi:hypothetical protein